MKAVIISIILFCLLLVGIRWNAVFVREVSGVLEEYGEKLSEPCDEDLKSLENYWESKREWLGISISGSYLDGVERTIISMRSAYESGDADEFRENLYIFRHIVSDVGKAERIALENIL